MKTSSSTPAAAGNNAILTLAAPGATGSLAANAALVIDGINDILNGIAGADKLNGGVGADTMTGGLGDDLYYVDKVGDRVVETSARGGFDIVYSTAAAYGLTGNTERGHITTGWLAVRVTTHCPAQQAMTSFLAERVQTL